MRRTHRSQQQQNFATIFLISWTSFRDDAVNLFVKYGTVPTYTMYEVISSKADWNITVVCGCGIVDYATANLFNICYPVYIDTQSIVKLYWRWQTSSVIHIVSSIIQTHICGHRKPNNGKIGLNWFIHVVPSAALNLFSGQTIYHMWLSLLSTSLTGEHSKEGKQALIQSNH